MRAVMVSLAILASTGAVATAESVPECMVHAKILQNPSALAGAAEFCMQTYFGNLKADADACRAEAAAKPLAGAELVACQAALIFGLHDQIELCRQEANDLKGANNELATQVGLGADIGCDSLVKQAAEICGDSAKKFNGLAQSAAESACEAAGL